MPPDKDHMVVRSYMAHHQGMTLLAIAYLLLDRPMQRRFTAAPSFLATELPATDLVHLHGHRNGLRFGLGLRRGFGERGLGRCLELGLGHVLERGLRRCLELGLGHVPE